VRLLAKVHQKIKRPRAVLHDNTALKLVQQRDEICHEDLQTTNMVLNRHLTKRISDAAWKAFLSALACKPACACRQGIAVNPAFTSQRCLGPSCGAIVQHGLSVRWHRCPECGTSLHQDHNAALNILTLGKQQRHGAGRALQMSI
jgi:putative transposase